MAKAQVFPLLVFFSAAATAFAGGFPTANLSTQWTNNPSLHQTTNYPDGSTIRPLLLQGWGMSFVFGFYCSAPCSTFLLSIFIVNIDSASDITGIFESSPQIVWTANRGRPVGENSTLTFSSDGDLFLRDADGSMIWATNTSGKGAVAVTLLGSGNLVLLDSNSSQIWASFDYPTDSLVFGQSLSSTNRLTANTSPTNTTPGYAYFSVFSDGLRAFVDSNPPQFYYKQTFSRIPNNLPAFMTLNNGSLNVYDALTNKTVLYYSIPLKLASSVQHLRIDFDGYLRLYDWQAGWDAFDVLQIQPYDCGSATVCGLYGICSSGQCSCPQGADGNSTYFKPVNAEQANLGCSPVTPLSCQFMKSHQLLPLGNLAYFNYIDASTISIDRTDVESCKQACLRNCSCKATIFEYNVDAALGSCYLPSQLFSLMENELQYTLHNFSTFIKVQPNLVPPVAPEFIATGSSASQVSKGMSLVDSLGKKVLVGLLSGFILAGILVTFITTICVRRRKAKKLEGEDHFDGIPGMACRFSYEEMKSATRNFEEKLGRGGFGTVFRGRLSNGMDIAVKRLDGVGPINEQFLAEVETIGSIHHINLVRLIGFCIEKSYRLLVFEYMPNGSLDKWIFQKENSALDWQTRCNIIIDIAKGLSYLHEGCHRRIAHLDIKPQNILLDKYFNAKVADFGLSKLIERDQSEVMTRMRGTPGYLAPEWLTSIITEKVDVYSFGVVVVEIICGKKSLDTSQPENAVHLISLVQEKLKNNLLLDLFDKDSRDMQLYSKEVMEMMRLAVWCLQSESSRRPSMSKVVKVLEASSNLDFDIDYDLLGDNIFM